MKSEVERESQRDGELCNYPVTRTGAIKEMYSSGRFRVLNARQRRTENLVKAS